jgi:DNA-binding NarL/FixJ family response regulator
MSIRVLVVDNHPVVRSGLRGMIGDEPDIEVIGEASSGEEAVTVAGQTSPDVVLMDLRMPGMDGAVATRLITTRQPNVRVLILTMYDNDTDIVPAVEAGAAGYLLKDAAREEVTDAIRAAVRGETVLAPPVAAKLVQHVRAPGATAALSAREVEVLSYVATGSTNADIAARLVISEATVKTHLVRIYAKLGVSDRTAAVTLAMQRGLLGRLH